MNRPHSPARDHRERTLAAQRQPEEPKFSPNATQYELMLAALHQAKHRLKGLQSIEKRAEVKRELITDFMPWINGAIDGNSGVQDDVLVTVMVWFIDINELPDALRLARYALDHKLVPPDQYKRTLGCLLAEEFAEAGLRDIIRDQPADVQSLLGIYDVTATEDMPDEVRAKLLKTIGFGLTPTDKPAALDYLKRAVALHDKVGVKKEIEKLEREIKNSALPPSGDTGQGDQG